MRSMNIGLKEALSMTLGRIEALPSERVDLFDSVDRIAASDLYALVNSPDMDISGKDGYAVLSSEVVDADVEAPVRLRILGSIGAGCGNGVPLEQGTAVRVLTGAGIPAGADSVVPDEVVTCEDNHVLINETAETGSNILTRGMDVMQGECILRAGEQITAGMTGLLAAAGHSIVPVFRNPVVGLLGIGDEIIRPGEILTENKVYASNIVTLRGWCERYKMKAITSVVKDDYDHIVRAINKISAETDALITSGGAWTGERDLVGKVLEGLDWKKAFHRIKIVPGKGVGFGMLGKKPVFILPGGPTSNLMGFLQIALPGLQALSGYKKPGLPGIYAKMGSGLRGRETDWTEFFLGYIESDGGIPTFFPLKKNSRLKSIANAAAVAAIPDGEDIICLDSIRYIQLLK